MYIISLQFDLKSPLISILCFVDLLCLCFVEATRDHDFFCHLYKLLNLLLSSLIWNEKRGKMFFIRSFSRRSAHKNVKFDFSVASS